MNCVDADSWQSAMSEEIDSLIINNTFDLVVAPKDAKIIKSRWVLAVKTDKNNLDTFEARFDAKGFSQVKDIDYSETFSPTVKITSIRMLMLIAANEN